MLYLQRTRTFSPRPQEADGEGGLFAPEVLLYYFPSHFLLIITSFTDALYASLFVIVYSYMYTIQSPNTALLSCLLWTLGIVIHLYTQYTQLLTSDSSCLISCYSCTQPCSSVLQCYINVPCNKKMKGKELHAHIRALLAQMEEDDKEEFFANAEKQGF